mmetsp:Transcript_46374/g.145218  ORF Transcript_46374/g.145218 Transcript_46374/m.145218 type:complete len:92 (-) Transcript_46374:41-316(-)
MDGFQLTDGRCAVDGFAGGFSQMREAEMTANRYGRRHAVFFLIGSAVALLACMACSALIFYSHRARRGERLLDDDDDDRSSVGYYEESYRG